MFDTQPAHRRFFAEMKRRRVFRVVAVYGAASFAALQAVDILVEGLSLPPVVLTIVTVLVIAGFPLSILAAWVYERHPDGGLRRTGDAEAGELEEIAGRARSHRWLPGLFALGGTALLLIGAWLVADEVIWRGSGADGGPSATAGGAVVAIVPFTVRGSPDVAYLGEGMVSLLGTKLDGAGDLRTVDARAVMQMLEREGLEAGDPSVGIRLAEGFGADMYVVGDIVEVGGRVQITAYLYETGARRPVGEADVAGPGDSMFDMVDALTAQLLSGLSGGPAARVRRIAAVTTESLPALKAFLEGEEQFRRGQFNASVESFRRAVAQDTTFALAYYRLSLVAEWNLQDELSRAAAEQTVRYRDRLAERDRRMLEAFLVRRRGDNLRAAEVYRSILGSYPDEMEAWLDLAEVQFHAYPLYGRPFTDAKESLEKVLEFDPDHSTALIHLARILSYEGRVSELDEVAARFVALHPDPGRTLEVEALRAYGTGDDELIEAVLARLPEADDLGTALAVWAASVYSRDVAGGEAVTRALAAPARSPEARRLAHAWLPQFALARGQLAEAKSRLAALAGLSPGTGLEYEAILATMPFVPTAEADLRDLAERLERLDPATMETSENPSIVFIAHDDIHAAIRLYQLGLIRAKLGEADAALEHAAELETLELAPTTGSLARDLAHGIRSAVLLGQGRLEEALSELEEAEMDTWYGKTFSSPLYARIHERFSRAELLLKLGRYEEAEPWYVHIAELSPFELPYLGVSYLRLAEIAEWRGDTAAAAEQAARFEELWSEADPEMRLAVGRP